MQKKILPLLAATVATTIYGLNHTIAKMVMPIYIGSLGLVLLRVLGATIIFWTIGLFFKSKPIEKKDRFTIIKCGLFGMSINIAAFIAGLDYSTPVNSSILIIISPIFVVILSFFIFRNKINLLKILGIIMGFIGALILILNADSNSSVGRNIPLGNFLFIVNSISYAYYLIIVKPMAQKYDLITLFKWLFLIGLIFNFPLGINQFTDVNWSSLPVKEAILPMAFVVICTTVMTYFLNGYALSKITSTEVAVFMYLQPIIGIVFAIFTKSDTISLTIIIASILIFIGVYLTSVMKQKK
ncbi:MAG: EamA family transporter [Flavobacteriaceae bacterium]|jgi:drug/metabolite transporter (DMT)-like permease|nr:EamA family transporter [Flavobacteriaceae bacterium]RCL69363.1 MAG: DMT family transporter [Cryomorphaceae bacterium]|tara:strand:+ start:1017 stop:1910 length:894 start_codon:yes stop_codon:yes gene_type:complete